MWSLVTVEFDTLWGPGDVEAGWVPSLRYALRRARILSLVRDLPRGRLLEVGCGAGAMLVELSRLGFACSGLETSAAARTISRRLAARYGIHSLDIRETPSDDWDGAFDVVAAFDVLEHIANDQETILTWIRWLRPGGKLLLSVPAHARQWGPGDEWAGHYRRYERASLSDLLVAAGCNIEHFECYGFPLGNLTEWLGKPYYRRMLATRRRCTPEQASSMSGIERRPYLKAHRLMHAWPGRRVLQIGSFLQNAFLGKDWGTGYLVLASQCAAC